MGRKLKRRKRLCECGCGEEVTHSTNYDRWNKYLPSHNRRGKDYWENKKLVARLCECGRCGLMTSPGKRFVIGHNFVTDTYLEKQKEPPICKCGCEKQTFWNRGTCQWNKFLNGHNGRGQKLLPETIAKILKANNYTSWNKGLSKETDDRLRLSGIKISKLQKGVPMSDVAKRATSKGLKKYYANLSKEERIELGNNRKGEKRSEQGRKNIRLASRKRWLDNPDEAKRISESVKKLWQDDDYRNNQMDIRGSKKYRKRVSKSAIQRVKEYPRTAGGYGESGYFFSKKNNKKVHYRSSYELVAYELLEQMSKVQSYEVEPFSIQYEWKNSKHRTLPDILVTYTDGEKELIEIKAKWRLEDEREIVKLTAMKHYATQNNLGFSVWMEGRLGIN